MRSSPTKPRDSLSQIVAKHETWRRRECLNLIPSENVTSDDVSRLLRSDFGHRYTARDRFYSGTRYTDEIETLAKKLASSLFKAPYSDVRPLSGHLANLALLFAFTQTSDTILSVFAGQGGYPGVSEAGAPRRLGLKNLYFPLCDEESRIDVNRTKALIQKQKPKLVIFGASLILFPHPIQELEQIAHEAGALVAYDGSHVLGLIAGEQFQDPLREGADVLLGSTHKSFFGPQGGILLARSEFGGQLDKALDPAVVDNAHWNRIAALCQALEEMREFGVSYALQVKRNAKALGTALIERKIPVRCKDKGITESHQVALAYGKYMEGGKIARRLERHNIITDIGIRLGTCELTRFGMKESEMERVAELISASIRRSKPVGKIRREVKSLRSDFSEIHYCFK
jgi:glycine hydroxymethyltransferase